jgi:hypothetical protein
MARVPSEYAQVFVELLNAKFAPLHGAVYGVNAGNKFDKITIVRNGTTVSVHAFVERETGHVYKAAGWAQPAKGVRYANVFEAAEAADRHGGYLYAPVLRNKV